VCAVYIYNEIDMEIMKHIIVVEVPFLEMYLVKPSTLSPQEDSAFFSKKCTST